MGPCNVEGGAMPAVPTAQLPLDLDLGRQTRELHRYFVVDIFTDTPLEGNQLAVFTDGRPFSSEQMQRLARELNLSETVFILPSQAGGDVHMRIFTPGTELPFAGHPVLGTAFVAGTALGGDVVRLETGLGVVPVELDRSGGGAAGGPSRTPCPYRLWRPDRNPAGRRDPAPVGPVRPSRGDRRPGPTRAGRRPGDDRRPRRVPARLRWTSGCEAARRWSAAPVGRVNALTQPSVFTETRREPVAALPMRLVSHNHQLRRQR